VAEARLFGAATNPKRRSRDKKRRRRNDSRYQGAQRSDSSGISVRADQAKTSGMPQRSRSQTRLARITVVTEGEKGRDR